MSASPFGSIHANAWAEPEDIASINQAASDLIFDRIEAVRAAGAREGAALPSASILLLGPAGAGKTHLFTRLRRRAGRRAVFIHTRPQIGVEPTPRFVLHSILDSLKQKVFGDEHMQLEIVAGAMLAAMEGGERNYPLVAVDDALRLDPEARADLIERVVGRIEDRFPGIAPDYLERLLAVPFAGRAERRALLAWLSGREPSMIELERLGAPGALADADVMRALSTLGVAAAYGAPVVLVFDQLENLAEDGGRVGRIHAHARLVSDLRDTVHGLVIVQMALDAEWVTRIHPALTASDRDRLEEKVVHLALPTPAERRALLEVWREALPEADRELPFPHPFPRAEVERWINDRGMTPRMLMQAAGEACMLRRESGPDSLGPRSMEAPPVSAPPREPSERLAAEWRDAMEKGRAEIDAAAAEKRGVPAERVASGLVATLRLFGAEVSPVASKAGPHLQATRDGSSVDVVVAQHGNHTSLAAAIRAAAAVAPARRVVLVRERAAPIPPTWKEVERLLATFVVTPGASFAWVDREDVARLLAIEGFVTAARSQDLSDEEGRPIAAREALAWAERALGLAAWPVMEALFPTARPEAPVSSGAPAGSAPRAPEPPRVPDRPRAAAPTARGGPARTVLERLRVASIERVVREAKAIDPAATRASVTTELRRGGVRFFGESIVALEDRWP